MSTTHPTPRLTQTARTLIRLLPEPVGIALARQIAALPPRATVFPAERAALEHATRIAYGADGRNIAYAWGDGPPVVLVHGWGGRGSQFGPLALAIAQAGFRAVAIDITGHGESARRPLTWSRFFDDIAALTRTVGTPVHAYVGHSAGGLAMMAARRLRGIRASRYACICSPSYPFKQLEVIRRRLAPSDAGMRACQDYIARQFKCSWDALQAGASFAGAGSDLLLYYDEKDRFIPHGEGDKIHALCAGAQFIKTNEHGHNRILGKPDLAEAMTAFLRR